MRTDRLHKSPYAPPASHVADPPQVLFSIARPKQVVVAVGLLWLGLAVSIPVVSLGFNHDLDADILPILVILTALTFAFSALLNVLIYRGRNWARMVSLVLYLLSGLAIFIPVDESVASDLLEDVLNSLVYLLDGGALYLLFSMPGKLWFNQHRQ